MNWVILDLTAYHRPQKEHPKNNMPCVESHIQTNGKEYSTISEMVQESIDQAEYLNIPITRHHINLTTFGVQGNTMDVVVPHYPYPFYDTTIRIKVRPGKTSLESAVREVMK